MANDITEDLVGGLSGPLSGSAYAGRAPRKPNLGASTEQLTMQQDYYKNTLNQRNGTAVRYPWMPPSNIPAAQARTSDPREKAAGTTESGKKRSFQRRKVLEALAIGERDPTQRRVRSGDNTPGVEVGVKGSQEVPTRDLNNESGKKIKAEGGADIYAPGLPSSQRISGPSGLSGPRGPLPMTSMPKENPNHMMPQDRSVENPSVNVPNKDADSNMLNTKPSFKGNPEISSESGRKKRIKEAYVWRTQKDERVREIHRALDGKKFNEDDPPVSGTDGFRGNPGEPANCRCFAEPVKEGIEMKTLDEVEHDMRKALAGVSSRKPADGGDGHDMRKALAGVGSKKPASNGDGHDMRKAMKAAGYKEEVDIVTKMLEHLKKERNPCEYNRK